MLYDLNLSWSPSTKTEHLINTLSFAASLGYGTVAINHTLETPVPSNPSSAFPKLDRSGGTLPNVLHRVTIPTSDPSLNIRLPNLLTTYDIIAVRPLTEKALSNACLTIDVPIISLDLTTFFPFHFRIKQCVAAVARGVHFEICYAQALNADSRGRANFIANASALVRATRGRGIVLSSEARGPLGLRAPADVVNLLSVWSLSSDKGMEGLRSIPRSVVVNEGIKRSGFRGVIDVVEVLKKPSAMDAPETTSDADKKRKHDEPTVSKRQAKKMRVAERAAAKQE